jgi:hypothetical protein
LLLLRAWLCWLLQLICLRLLRHPICLLSVPPVLLLPLLLLRLLPGRLARRQLLRLLVGLRWLPWSTLDVWSTCVVLLLRGNLLLLWWALPWLLLLLRLLPSLLWHLPLPGLAAGLQLLPVLLLLLLLRLLPGLL